MYVDLKLPPLAQLMEHFLFETIIFNRFSFGPRQERFEPDLPTDLVFDFVELCIKHD